MPVHRLTQVLFIFSSGPDLSFQDSFSYILCIDTPWSVCPSYLTWSTACFQDCSSCMSYSWTLSFNGANSLPSNFLLPFSPGLWLSFPCLHKAFFHFSLPDIKTQTCLKIHSWWICIRARRGRSAMNNQTSRKEKQHQSQLMIAHEAKMSRRRWILLETLNGLRLQRSFKYFPCHLNFNL